MSAPQSFRDGIFSQSDPLAPYGILMTSYSDGSLGAKLSRDTAEKIRTEQASSPPSDESSTYSADTYTAEESKTPWLLIAGVSAAVIAAGAYVVFRK